VISQSEPESIDWPDLPPSLKVRHMSIKVPISCSNHDRKLRNNREDLDPPYKSKKECKLKNLNKPIISVIKCLLLLIVGWRNDIWSSIEHSKGIKPVKDIADDYAPHQSWDT
jgi:hypothetical protein